MVRKLKINNADTGIKISIISGLMNIKLSDTELGVLESLCCFESTGSIALTPQITKQIRTTINVTEASFNTAIHRLADKKAINKNGRTILINPAFIKLNDLAGVLIEFNPASDQKP